MAATRTQVYLTQEQRERLDRLAAIENRTMAALVRDAVDLFLAEFAPDPDAALERTFGAVPRIEAPDRIEWSRRG